MTFSVEDWRRLTNAAYWEGYGTVAKFVRATMERYLAARENERGKNYPAKPEGTAEDDE